MFSDSNTRFVHPSSYFVIVWEGSQPTRGVSEKETKETIPEIWPDEILEGCGIKFCSVGQR
jgi:hypothetical protein